jgi:hypothetical protein
VKSFAAVSQPSTECVIAHTVSGINMFTKRFALYLDRLEARNTEKSNARTCEKHKEGVFNGSILKPLKRCKIKQGRFHPLGS